MKTAFIALALGLAFAVAAPAPVFAKEQVLLAPNGRPKDLPPPPPFRDDGFAPPQGLSPNGINFGRWRSDAPQSVSEGFAASVKAMTPQALRQAMEKAGFACQDANRPDARPVPSMECRLVYSETSCQYEWRAQLWPNEAQPRANFEKACR